MSSSVIWHTAHKEGGSHHLKAVLECALTVKCCRQQQQQQRLHLTRANCEARTRLDSTASATAAAVQFWACSKQSQDNGLLEILIFVCGNCNNCCCNQPMQKSPTSKRRWQICKSRCSIRGGEGEGLEVGSWPWPSFLWCCH